MTAEWPCENREREISVHVRIRCDSSGPWPAGAPGPRDAADRLSDHGKAQLVEFTERQALLTDCLTMCKNVGLSMDVLDFELASDLLRAGTGLKFTDEKVDTALKNTITNDRLLNIDFGMTAKDDTLPDRFTKDTLTEGASKDQVVPVHDMVKEYYKIRGWDENGVPKKR